MVLNESTPIITMSTINNFFFLFFDAFHRGVLANTPFYEQRA